MDGITVTRHIKLSDKELFGKLGASETAAIAPGVAGQTGIETSELVKSTAKSISPVSYTHLDVYKRQPRSIITGSIFYTLFPIHIIPSFQ